MIHTFYYHGDDSPATGLTASQISGALSDPAGVLWMDLDGCGDDEARVALAALGIGHHAIEACLWEGRRPRLDIDGDWVFFNTRWPVSSSDEGAARTHEVGVFIGRNVVVSHHRHASAPVTALRHAVASDAALLARGPDAVAAVLLHSLTAEVSRSIADLAAALVAAEAGLLRGDRAPVASFHESNVRLREMSRLMAPLAEVLGGLGSGEVSVVGAANRAAFREVQGAIAADVEWVEDREQRAVLTMVAYASAATASLHGKVRLIAALQAVLLPALLLTAVFGATSGSAPMLEPAMDAAFLLGALGVVAVAMALVYRWWR